MTRLDRFRTTHQAKHLVVDATRWSYISSGRGDRVILLLPGGLASSDSLFYLIEALEKRSRVIAPSLPLSTTSIEEVVRGLTTILDAELVERAAVMGTSYGGWIAQQLAARSPERVLSLALVHTFTLTARDMRKLRLSGRIASGILRRMPGRLIDLLLRMRAQRILLAPLRAADHEDLDSWKQLVTEAVAGGALRSVAKHQADVLSAFSKEPGECGTFRGPVLIIESDDDPAVRARARRALKNRYPDARVFTFRETGHVSSIVATKELTALVESFFDVMP